MQGAWGFLSVRPNRRPMDLSVVIPSFNQREELTQCLEALTAVETTYEVIVVNGPSTDGTSGIVRDREDIDCLLECASRNLNVARNVGLREARADKIALLSADYAVTPGWSDAIIETLNGTADAVSGPARDRHQTGTSARAIDRAGPAQELTQGNVAITRGALTALDGFDEYLEIGGTRDLNRRLSHLGLGVVWHPDMRVYPIGRAAGSQAIDPPGWIDQQGPGWGAIYRSSAYLRVKNDGLGPRVIGGVLGAAVRDGATASRDVLAGQGRPSAWLGNGQAVLTNIVVGCRRGRRARQADRTNARNPHGLSRNEDEHVVEKLDRRSQGRP